MAVRIRKDGRIFCAAHSEPEQDDTYIHDGIHYMLSVEFGVLVTQPMPLHVESGGEWWWRDSVPAGIEIDDWRFAEHQARDEFVAASVAVWREIDRLTASPGGYPGLPQGVPLRQRERAAWEKYRDLIGDE